MLSSIVLGNTRLKGPIPQYCRAIVSKNGRPIEQQFCHYSILISGSSVCLQIWSMHREFHRVPSCGAYSSNPCVHHSNLQPSMIMPFIVLGPTWEFNYLVIKGMNTSKRRGSNKTENNWKQRHIATKHIARQHDHRQFHYDRCHSPKTKLINLCLV